MYVTVVEADDNSIVSTNRGQLQSLGVLWVNHVFLTNWFRNHFGISIDSAKAQLLQPVTPAELFDPDWPFGRSSSE